MGNAQVVTLTECLLPTCEESDRTWSCSSRNLQLLLVTLYKAFYLAPPHLHPPRPQGCQVQPLSLSLQSPSQPQNLRFDSILVKQVLRHGLATFPPAPVSTHLHLVFTCRHASTPTRANAQARSSTVPHAGLKIWHTVDKYLLRLYCSLFLHSMSAELIYFLFMRVTAACEFHSNGRAHDIFKRQKQIFF